MIKELATGLGVTFENLFKKPVTVKYPEEKLEMFPRFRGLHILARHADGLERCVGCELCAVACPADAIFLEKDYELSDYNRDAFIYTKDELVVPMEKSGYLPKR